MNQNYYGNRRSEHFGNSGSRQQTDVEIIYPSLDNKELLGNEAYILTKKIVDACNGDLTKTQVRRFYSEVKNIERCLDETEISDSVYGRIKLIKAKAAYSTARKSNKLPKKFAEFLGHYIDEINNNNGAKTARDNFEKFARLFEAFVGYSYAMGLSD